VALDPYLRHLGLAARFVSGYLMQLRPDIDPVEGPREVESDFTDLACLGGSLSSRRGLDRVRRHFGHADRRGQHSRCCHALTARGAPISGTGRFAEGRIRVRT